MIKFAREKPVVFEILLIIASFLLSLALSPAERLRLPT